MNIVGLTGGIASGKTTVSHFFSRLAIPIIDADVINHRLILPKGKAYIEIIKAFPDIPLLNDRSLDKKYLKNKIFNEAISKQLLEHILHPLIESEIKQQIKTLSLQRHPYCIVSVPLMIEANFTHLISTLWVCDCKQSTQLKRLIKRDKILIQDAKIMLSHQLSRQQRLSFADHIIPTEHKTPMEDKIKYLHQQQIKLNSH